MLDGCLGFRTFTRRIRRQSAKDQATLGKPARLAFRINNAVIPAVSVAPDFVSKMQNLAITTCATYRELLFRNRTAKFKGDT
jgi:hypothetical protein